MCSSGGQIATNDEALQSAQNATAATLNKDYLTTFGESQQLLNANAVKLQAMAANPMGYSPQFLHSAKASINDNTAAAAQKALGSAAAFAAAHGGADVGSGATGIVAGQIGSQAAQSKAAQLSSLAQSNEQLKQENMWKSIQGLNETGSALNNSGATTLSGANSAAESSVGAGSGALAAKQAGWQNVAGILGGLGGLAQAGVGAYGDFLHAGKP